MGQDSGLAPIWPEFHALNTTILFSLALIINGSTGCGVLQGRVTKLERFWAKTNCIQMYSNFENWSSSELSKIGHHFLMLSLNGNNKKCAPKFDKVSDNF